MYDGYKYVNTLGIFIAYRNLKIIWLQTLHHHQKFFITNDFFKYQYDKKNIYKNNEKYFIYLKIVFLFGVLSITFTQ